MSELSKPVSQSDWSAYYHNVSETNLKQTSPQPLSYHERGKKIPNLTFYYYYDESCPTDQNFLSHSEHKETKQSVESSID